MNKVYDVQRVTVTSQSISFELKSEKIAVPLEQIGSNLLMSAQEDQLQIFEVDIDGIGIYWPLIDEDLSISGLLRSAGKENLVVKEIGSIYSENFDRKAS